jgi:uncharacterized membrane protein YebE (DUF533 family)
MSNLQKLMGNLTQSGALNGFLGGVAGGGLTSLLTSKKGKKTGKKALKLGALAAVGTVAWKAYQNYSQRPEAAAATAPAPSPSSSQNSGAARPAGANWNYAPAQLPQASFEHVVDDNNSSGQLLIMRAMIAAAYADGHIDAEERATIFANVEQMPLSVEDKALLFDELRQPLSQAQLVAAVPDAQTGIEVYAASVSAIDPEQVASQQYLQSLAAQLCIPSELVATIHSELQG